jgi:hypothetical protein
VWVKRMWEVCVGKAGVVAQGEAHTEGQLFSQQHLVLQRCCCCYFRSYPHFCLCTHIHDVYKIKTYTTHIYDTHT